ncbi:MAG: ATP-dependent DNA helicase RecQ [Bacteroidota bacterium]|nr:ATP-dependent DNA helicase RecQ [Bacteroidota bacterium]
MKLREILYDYWGYSSFRPKQEDVIHSVLEGNDTLALFPTGGGKSLCFQVPALAKEGLCIVVTPLIALMKDQVENLKRRDIKAAAIYSGMTRGEIDLVYTNALYGGLKFLYVSPERIVTDVFRQNLKMMKVNLLAVDEAHCISQWGYDFRPSYLRIAELKEFLPGVPLLALTATATPEVVKDIQKYLRFKEENLFQRSFERTNLTYVVLKDENKENRLLKIVSKIKGSGIVYVRSRKKTRLFAQLLIKNGISADYYHAGLDINSRTSKQQNWFSGKTRVIVSTNAFGMGIDKSDVRFVVHLDIPDCVESYFQEAGRAGRDEKRSYAVLLFDDSDIASVNNSYALSYPELSTIKRVYEALGNYFQIAVGAGNGAKFEFDISNFSEQYSMKPLVVYNCIKFLERDGYLLMNNAVFNTGKAHIKVQNNDLYAFQIENKRYDFFIELLLRSYSGLFNDYVNINESVLAKRMNTSVEEIKKALVILKRYDILDYIQENKKPFLIYLRERVNGGGLNISSENYALRKKMARERLDSMLDYAESVNHCRSQILLAYFGEDDVKRCGKCDICLKRNKVDMSKMTFDDIVMQIKPVLLNEALTIDTLCKKIHGVNVEKLLKVVQFLLDGEKITKDVENKIHWKG